MVTSKSTGGAHDTDFVPEELAEEENIMAERAAKVRTFDAQTLKAPVKVLGLGKAVSVAPSATVHEAVESMQKDRHGCIPVIEKGKLVGIFTERDVLMKLAGKGKDWKKEKVSSYMTPNPETIPETGSLAFALNMMTEGGYRHIPIVDEKGGVLSVLSVKDVMRYICQFFEKDIRNLPPRPGLLHPTKDGG